MERLDNFAAWMQRNKSLSDSSKYKYRQAINTISKDMLREGVIYKQLIDMNLLELDLAMINILENDFFKHKNAVGHKMYSNSLKQYRYYLLLNDGNDYAAEEEELIKDRPPTERIVLHNSRIGQGDYREGLMEKYGGKCVITGISHPKLLIASHIKPWKVADDIERLDVNNGLLLSANMDKLFDSGLITFDANGHMKISSFLTEANTKLLGISKNMVVDLQPSGDFLRYMEYHRDVLFIK